MSTLQFCEQLMMLLKMMQYLLASSNARLIQQKLAGVLDCVRRRNQSVSPSNAGIVSAPANQLFLIKTLSSYRLQTQRLLGNYHLHQRHPIVTSMLISVLYLSRAIRFPSRGYRLCILSLGNYSILQEEAHIPHIHTRQWTRVSSSTKRSFLSSVASQTLHLSPNSYFRWDGSMSPGPDFFQ